jgi:periplasmic divalent cation tolerance protein
MSETRAIMLYSAFPTESEARAVGQALVESKLAACVNIFPAVASIFVWRGVLETAHEAVMIAKTAPHLKQAAMAEIKRRHSYETPAIVAYEAVGGSEDYLDWIAAQTLDLS